MVPRRALIGTAAGVMGSGLEWNVIYYVHSHGNLNLATISASEITSASQPSAPVTRVDLGFGI